MTQNDEFEANMGNYERLRTNGDFEAAYDALRAGIATCPTIYALPHLEALRLALEPRTKAVPFLKRMLGLAA